jgi:hypothetical protein
MKIKKLSGQSEVVFQPEAAGRHLHLHRTQVQVFSGHCGTSLLPGYFIDLHSLL